VCAAQKHLQETDTPDKRANNVGNAIIINMRLLDSQKPPRVPRHWALTRR
jgi:hypothetical protein